MQTDDEGIIIKKTKYRESSLLISFFSLNHGINSGLVKGVLKKDFGTYEIGNKVYIKSSFRLDEQLWNCKFELIKNNSVNYFDNQNKLNTLLTICSIIDLSLPKNNPQIKIYNKTIDLMEDLLSKGWAVKYIFWELFLLSELGYGLDLEKCVVSGKKENLIYISPKSGKAVSKKEGEKYKNNLLYLPKFLINKNVEPTKDSLKQGISLTGFFINKFLKKSNKKIKYTIVGPICETADTFAKNKLLNKINTNELLFFKNVGAYGSSMSFSYNSRPIIMELIIYKNNFSIIRKVDTVVNQISREKIPSWISKIK